MDANYIEKLYYQSGFRPMTPTSPSKRILIVHAWLRGNLGDACMQSILLNALCPHYKVDIFADPFLDFRGNYTEWFRNYNVILIAPGGGIQNKGDHRATYIFRDAQFCIDNNIRCAFTSHSIDRSYLKKVPSNCLFLSREQVTHSLLPHSALTSDLAWTQHVPAIEKTNKRLLFLRHDNYRNLYRKGNFIFHENGVITEVDQDTFLCTSDPEHDQLPGRSKSLELPYIECDTLDSLFKEIGAANRVSTDRYHPAIFAKIANCPYIDFYERPISRDTGLRKHLTMDVEELRHMSQKGIEMLLRFIEEAPC